MWSVKKRNKQKSWIQRGDRGKDVGGWAKWVTGVSCMGCDGNLTFSGDQFVVYTDIKL